MKVLILGSSGWIAHYLIKDLIDKKYEVIGISNKSEPKYNIKNCRVDISNDKFLGTIKEVNADIVINMIHSDDYIRCLELHKELIEHCLDSNKDYVYMSSGNALDGDVTRVHEEDEAPNASSEYGQYKAKCEEVLNKSKLEALIIRFPQIHGYAPNRVSRTEEFLKQLSSGDKVLIPQGIIQNRLHVSDLSSIITRLICDSQKGTFHLGANDYSDESIFRIKLAEAFGHSREQLELGEDYKFNTVIKPKRIYDLYDDEFRFDEQRTILKLSGDSTLFKYKKES